MSYWTYILESASTGGHYCGPTDDLARRLGEHNDPDYHGSKTTKRFPGPWRLVWSEEHPTRADAMKRERSIKNRGIRRFLATPPTAGESCPRQD